MAHNAKRYQYAQSSGKSLADCRTRQDRERFQQRVERDYKRELGAKALGIYGTIWQFAGNQSLKTIIGNRRLASDNGIKSKGGMLPHLRRLEAAGLIQVRARFDSFGQQLANEYILLDPYLPVTLDPSDYADFLLRGGSNNDVFLKIKSPVFDGRDLIFLDLEEIYASENAMSAPQRDEPLAIASSDGSPTGAALVSVEEGTRDDAQSPPPQLSQAAAAGGTGISAVLVVEDKTEPLVTEKPGLDSHPALSAEVAPSLIETAPTEPLVNEVDVVFALIPEGEQETWYARAVEALVSTGVAEALRIVPVVRDMAFRLWVELESDSSIVGSTIPGPATG